MNTYQIKFYVNGKPTEQIVKAMSSTDAKKLIQTQYAGQKINFTLIKTL